MANEMIVAGGPGIRRDEMSATSMATTGETGSTALAAQAEAMVKARFIVALQRPRDIDDVRARMLKECKRPGFAEVAIYRKPIGKGVEGLSIRFAEAAIRCMRNIAVETTTLYDDPMKRLVRVNVSDIEANTNYFTDIMVEKTVERRSPKDGQEVLGQRLNSNGDVVYLVAATEDELLTKQSALVSKALRTNGLRLIPGDILDECEETLRTVRRKRDAADPDAARKKLCDSFSELGIMPSDLKELLGHDIGSASPAEIDSLRGVFVAIKDGETTWAECSGRPLTDFKTAKAATKAQAVQDEILGGKKPASAPRNAKPAESEVDALTSQANRERLLDAMEAAQTQQALLAVGNETGKTPLLDSDREFLRQAYAANLQRVKAPKSSPVATDDDDVAALLGEVGGAQ